MCCMIYKYKMVYNNIMSKIEECEYIVIGNESESEIYDFVEHKDLGEYTEIFVIIDDKEKKIETYIENEELKSSIYKNESLELRKNFEKDIPTLLSHPWRYESRIPTSCENIIWISVPKTILTQEFQILCSHYNYPKTRALKDGYINIPEEWVFYKGNPAFISDELFHIFAQNKK